MRLLGRDLKAYFSHKLWQTIAHFPKTFSPNNLRRKRNQNKLINHD